jgi:hypothetical protein
MRERDAASGPIARDKAGLHPMRVGVISVVFRQLLIGLASLEREPANRRSSAARALGQKHPMKTPTHEAVAHCGSAVELARRLGLHDSAIAKWRVRGGKIPLAQVHRVHEVTRIPLARLRPDFFGRRSKPNQLR